MEEVTVVDLRNRLGDVLGRVAYARERFVVMNRGKPKAAIISIEDLEQLEDLEDAQAVREAMAEYERGEMISLDELEARLAGNSSEIPG